MDEARAVLAEQAASGLSVWAFVQAHGLSSKKLYEWRRRLAEQGANERRDSETETADEFSEAGLER